MAHILSVLLMYGILLTLRQVAGSGELLSLISVLGTAFTIRLGRISFLGILRTTKDATGGLLGSRQSPERYFRTAIPASGNSDADAARVGRTVRGTSASDWGTQPLISSKLLLHPIRTRLLRYYPTGCPQDLQDGRLHVVRAAHEDLPDLVPPGSLDVVIYSRCWALVVYVPLSDILRGCSGQAVDVDAPAGDTQTEVVSHKKCSAYFPKAAIDAPLELSRAFISLASAAEEAQKAAGTVTNKDISDTPCYQKCSGQAEKTGFSKTSKTEPNIVIRDGPRFTIAKVPLRRLLLQQIRSNTRTHRQGTGKPPVGIPSPVSPAATTVPPTVEPKSLKVTSPLAPRTPRGPYAADLKRLRAKVEFWKAEHKSQPLLNLESKSAVQNATFLVPSMQPESVLKMASNDAVKNIAARAIPELNFRELHLLRPNPDASIVGSMIAAKKKAMRRAAGRRSPEKKRKRKKAQRSTCGLVDPQTTVL